jgi:hypothetical protein
VQTAWRGAARVEMLNGKSRKYRMTGAGREDLQSYLISLTSGPFPMESLFHIDETSYMIS